ncbi:MAG: lipid kinase [Gloeocapsa sp. DLM2.Bin57]|nr:MAG: lipid kinase [Gloeocapsa sp. DLM2.Bin57]
MSKKALLLINPRSRQGKKQFKLAVDILHELDFELVVIPCNHPQEIPEIINQQADNVDLVIIGGGDGTLNLAVDSLVTHNLPLGILPMGTANDLARTLGIPLGIKEACQVIASGKVDDIDLGWVNGKYFFNVASLGLSVKITENLSYQAKRRWGTLAYLITAIKVIRNSIPFEVEIIIGDTSVSVKTIQVAVGNGCYYGGGMAVAKDAKINDQRLDLYSLELENWWQIFPLIWTLPQGGHDILPWVRTLQAYPSQSIIIKSPKPLTINTDGELTVTTPATFKVIPQALRVFISN